MISSEEPIRKLKRYTHFPQLLHMLSTATITALSPTLWEDKNDLHYLERYKAARPDVKTLLALCMTDAADTYHQWNVFANGPSGVKIEFKPKRFQSWAAQIPGSRLKRVEYLRIEEFESAAHDTICLPFLKRMAFRDEDEIRLVIEDTEKTETARSFPFDLSIIKKISLSPWLPIPLEDTVINTLRAIYKGSDEQWNAMTVRRTSLLANEKVMSAGKS